ncbi:hypothetical protein ROZALSC1DRAFT_24573 [Rozella allomycis CSF55]|uniref:Uncharacterized protein n=1 Tax=Rozella allomycis (strain CSF55) TaxID=988480 RepID=A0A4P9YD82_ROZAC|nr:hypothetical protein ROZALSC1DRAFT_24573 [Rozella allomycis CSF55]
MEPTSKFDEVASNLSTLDPVQILKNLNDRANELRLAVSLVAKKAFECPPEAFPKTQAKPEEEKPTIAQSVLSPITILTDPAQNDAPTTTRAMTAEVVTKLTDDKRDAKVVAQVFKNKSDGKVSELYGSTYANSKTAWYSGWPSLTYLKNALLKEFISPYWKTEKMTQIFQVQYNSVIGQTKFFKKTKREADAPNFKMINGKNGTKFVYTCAHIIDVKVRAGVDPMCTHAFVSDVVPDNDMMILDG